MGQETRNAVIYINGVEIENNLRKISSFARTTKNELAGLTRGTDEYNKKLQGLQQANKIIEKHNTDVRGIGKTWSGIKQQIISTSAVLLSFLGAQAIFSGFSNLIRKSAELSEAFADIRKTTGLSQKEVEGLSKKLGEIDTTTGRLELLKLAKEAGKLGYDSADSIKKFVEQADQINVALGEELGEGAITQIGKLANIFKTDLLSIGSALNEVGASGIASEGWQVDYLSRLSGIAETANLSLPDLLGYGAALESMGQTAEVSGTALNQFFLKFISNTDKFAEIAGISAEELRKLIGSEGTNAGFVYFLEQLKAGAVSSGDMILKLNEMGLDGARASNVLLSLANNTGEVSKQQKIANDAYKKGTSVTEEFARKQDSFAADLERLRKKIYSIFMDNAITRGVQNLVSGISNLIAPTEKVSENMEQERLSMNALVLQITSLNEKNSLRKELMVKLKEQYGKYFPDLNLDTAMNIQLLAALKDVNEALVNRIIIQKYDEQLAEAADKSAGLRIEKMEQEAQLAEYLLKAQEEYGVYLSASLPLMDKATSAIAQLNNEGSKGAEYLSRSIEKITKIDQTALDRFFGNKGFSGSIDNLTKKLTDADAVLQKINDDKNAFLATITPNGPENYTPGGTKGTGEFIPGITDTEEKAAKLSKDLKEIQDYLKQIITTGVEMKTNTGDTNSELTTLVDILLGVEKMMSGTDFIEKTMKEKAKENSEWMRQRREESHQEDLKAAQDEIKIEEDKWDALIELAQAGTDVLDAIASLSDAKNKRLQKALAVASIAANTAIALANMLRAASAAAAATGPLAPAVLAGYIATGFAEVFGAAASIKAVLSEGYFGGGPTGDGDENEVAGVVHKKEYVVPYRLMNVPAVQNAVGNIEALRKGTSGGSTISTTTNNYGNEMSEAVLMEMRMFREALENGKLCVIMPDQTIKKFNERNDVLTKLDRQRKS